MAGNSFWFGGRLVTVAGVLTAGLVACGGGDDDARDGSGGGSSEADPQAGTTAIVAIVNPVVNTPHSTGVPAELGDDRSGIEVRADPGGDDVTSSDGLAVVDVPAGSVALAVGAARALAHTVMVDGDLYDAAIAYDGADAVFFDNTPIRYPVGDASEAHFYDAEDALDDINTRLEEDDVVVVLRPGTYVGSLSITGTGVLLFGEGWSDRSVIIDGSIVASGGQVRLRGLTITGDLTANGNGFGIGFSVVLGNTEVRGNGGAFLRNIFCGDAAVPSSNATLLDNHGVPPLLTLPSGICD